MPPHDFSIHTLILLLLSIVIFYANWKCRDIFGSYLAGKKQEAKISQDEEPYLHNGGTPTKKTWKEMDGIERTGTIMGMAIAAIIVFALFAAMAFMGGISHIVTSQ